MTDMKLRKLVLAALFAALCTVMTMVVQVPRHAGLRQPRRLRRAVSAWVLGPWLRLGAAAGLGRCSRPAELSAYAPRTLVIKFTMAVARGVYF